MKKLLWILLVLLPVLASADEAADALQMIRPGAEWVLTGSDYSGIKWLDHVQAKPTLPEFNLAVARVDVYRKRAAEYPSISEKVDALLAGGNTLSDLQKRIKDIDAKYPLP